MDDASRNSKSHAAPAAERHDSPADPPSARRTRAPRTSSRAAGAGPRQATIRDVAREANVSTATVSRVVSDNGYPVAAETRERVLSTVRRLGYQPNDLARSLLSERTHTVGVIVPDLSNPHHPGVVRGIEDVAAKNGYSVLFCNTEGRQDKLLYYLDIMAGKRVDGVILAGGGLDPNSAIRALEGLRTKTVVIGRYSRSKFPSVQSDNHSAGRLAAEHLIDLGHNRISIITGPKRSSASVDRLAGAVSALQAAGIDTDPALVVEGDYLPMSGYRAAAELLVRKDPPTALIAANDRMAIGAMGAALDRGLRVPEDVAVAGYDDTLLARYVRPTLTSIALPTRQMGATAMQSLLSLLGGEETALTSVLSVSLVVRQSTVGGSPVMFADDLDSA